MSLLIFAAAIVGLVLAAGTLHTVCLVAVIAIGAFWLLSALAVVLGGRKIYKDHKRLSDTFFDGHTFRDGRPSRFGR